MNCLSFWRTWVHPGCLWGSLDTKGVIRIRKSKKNRQHNGQKKRYKGTNNDRVKRTPQTPGVNSCSPEGKAMQMFDLPLMHLITCSLLIDWIWQLKHNSRFDPNLSTHRANLVTNPVIRHEWGKDRIVFTTSGTYPWSFVTQIFQSCHKQQLQQQLCLHCTENIFDLSY
jgi:hypothetical protein